MNEWVIETRGLTRERGGRRVVDAVTMTLEAQRMVGLLGRSGAGKTALLEMLAGVAKPTAGQVQVRGSVGYVPQQVSFSFLAARQTVRDYLLRRTERGMPRMKRAARLGDLLARTGLALGTETPVGQLPPGLQRQLLLAAAMVNPPALLLLDDPCGGQDPLAVQQTEYLLDYYRQQGGTILLASRRVTTVEQACDTLLLMREGQIVETLSQTDPTDPVGAVVDLEVSGITDDAMDALRGIAPKLKMQGMPPTRLTAYIAAPALIPDLARAVVENGARLHSLVPHEETLEERYLRFLAE